MKLAQLRMADHAVTLNEEDWPVTYRFHLPALDFSIEVRRCERQGAAYVNGKIVRDGATAYAGRGGIRSYSEFGLHKTISEEMFNVAEALNVPAHHVWPFVDQLPAFSESGVKISDAEAFETPIRDLLARGASPHEVVCSLGISPDLYEFVVREEIPPLLQPSQDVMVAADEPIW